MATAVDNPFPLQAVAVYGTRSRASAEFGYMSECLRELNAYLVNYPETTFRSGGAIPIIGEPGAGKTHTLAWLADHARSRERAAPFVVYVKVSAPRVFDIYRQTMAQIDHAHLVALYRGALRQLAVDELEQLKLPKAS